MRIFAAALVAADRCVRPCAELQPHVGTMLRVSAAPWRRAAALAAPALLLNTTERAHCGKSSSKHDEITRHSPPTPRALARLTDCVWLLMSCVTVRAHRVLAGLERREQREHDAKSSRDVFGVCCPVAPVHGHAQRQSSAPHRGDGTAVEGHGTAVEGHVTADERHGTAAPRHPQAPGHRRPGGACPVGRLSPAVALGEPHEHCDRGVTCVSRVLESELVVTHC